ncbi:MAG: transglutaminase domain-containing protein [Chloroflexota bacterium]|nr:transglutaminase domain-containing protein [Chloroflexota bacterium]
MTLAYDTAHKRSWILYLMIACAILILPLSIRTARWFPVANRLVHAALWGAMVGMAIAGSPLPHWLAWWLGTVLGVEYALLFAGELLPGVHVILQDLGHFLGWLWDLAAHGSLGAHLPFEQSASHLIGRTEEMVQNLTTWFAAIEAGEVSKDTTALKILVSFIVWLVSWNVTYELFSRRRIFVALLPLGVIIVANASYTGVGLTYVHFFLFIMLLLLVRGNLERMEVLWQSLGLDFSPELRRDATIAGILLSGAILALVLLIPYMTYNKAVFFFWDRVGPTLESFYDKVDRAFAGRNPVPEPTPDEKGLGRHSITASGTLAEDVVFIVETSDPPPPPEEELMMLREEGLAPFVPKRYWRERTYDLYTGHGWDSSERNTRTMDADRAWKEVDYPHETLTQTFNLQDTSASFGFGVNEPVRVNQEYQLITRGNGDLAAFSVQGDMYTVISKIPEVTEQVLRAAEGDYPNQVAEHYTDLPEGIPDRVLQEAQRIVQEAGATTRYDKARAIEAYIRRFEYTEELDPPPMDRDIVDYFLFTAQKGYCDYSATTMVVLLRAAGVASRYASGYGMGHYDYAEEGWVVTQRTAHAWVEVYFPGYGWIEFEPTPTQSIFSREGGNTAPMEPLDTESPGQERKVSPLLLWAGGLALVVLFVIVWPLRWFGRRNADPRQGVWGIYDKLVRRARWAGFGPRDGQTPREYLSTLASQIESHTSVEVQGDMGTIGDAYLKALYSEMPVSEEEYHLVVAAFKRIRGKLVRLVFAGGSHTTAHA